MRLPTIFAAFLTSIMLAGCSATSILNLLSLGGSVTVTPSVPYGEGERRTYDLYVPDEASDGPVVIFFYGGSWDSGNKEMYEFVGNAFASAGFVTAIPDYRIYPETSFPGFVEDGAAAVTEIYRTVAEGRPVALVGHSAGAHIASLLTYDPSYLDAVGLDVCEAVAGLVGMAGPYDFTIDEPRYERIFPEASRTRSQPIAFADGPAPPSYLLHGADDTTVHPEDTQLMADALRRAGNRVETTIYPDVDHAFLVGSIAAPLRFKAPTLDDTVSFLRALRPDDDNCR